MHIFNFTWHESRFVADTLLIFLHPRAVLFRSFTAYLWLFIRIDYNSLYVEDKRRSGVVWHRPDQHNITKDEDLNLGFSLKCGCFSGNDDSKLFKHNYAPGFDDQIGLSGSSGCPFISLEAPVSSDSLKRCSQVD